MLFLFLSIVIFFKFFESRLVNSFKNKIIDKTDINLDFKGIHFSILKNFPYGSFILDDAKIFYSKLNRNDTLVDANKLCFKINTINLFSSIYEFPEIIVSDGSISIKGEMLDSLFSKDKNPGQETNYLIETKNIKLIRCKVNYCYEKSIKLKLYIDKSSCSGSFLSKSLSFKLKLNIYSLYGNLNGFIFKSTDLIDLSSTIIGRDGTYYSENGEIKFNTMKFRFSFLYNIANELLQITTTSNKVYAKYFCQIFLSDLKIPITKGQLLFDSFYSINFKNTKSQKLTLKYKLENVSLNQFKGLSILTLNGTTTFTDDFSKNSSEISNYKIHYNGFELDGSSKIKNFPHPVVLLDTRVKGSGELKLKETISFDGNISGKIKALIKIDDIRTLDIRTLNISKVNSDLAFSNFSIKNIDYLENLSGNLLIVDNSLHLKGSGLLFKETFKGTLMISDFLDVAFHDLEPSPIVSLEMYKLNIDSILLNTTNLNDSKTSLNYELTSKIKKLKYKGIDINDLNINLKSRNDKYVCDYFRLNAFKGQISGNFTYSRQDRCNVSFTGQQIDIQKLFIGFNNFEQKIITKDNISGLLSGKVDLSYRFLKNEKVDQLSIKMVSDIVIENGKLSGVSQLKRVSKFLNLSEVDSFHFKTLRNKIEIEQGVIKIPSMEIASNALNFTLAGQHRFDGEFSYWLKLNLKEILAKKYLQKKVYNSDYEKDDKNGLNLFLKIYGNNESFKVSFDKKSTVEHVKENLNQEGILLKRILKEELGLSKKNALLQKDSLTNKIDTTHNKNQKKPFRIEWDEIDTTKNL